MSDQVETQSHAGFQRLRGNVGAAQYFALGFGCIIGSSWVIIAGDWMAGAGPGGAILGFLLGGAVLALIGACYAELTSRVPEAGSEFAYARRVFGDRAAFAVGWFLLLYFLAVTVFEGLAIAWILELVWPALGSGELYSLFGGSVSMSSLAIGAIGAIVLAAVNLIGVQSAARLQSVLTYGFLTIALILLAMLLPFGSVDNAQPLFESASDSPWYYGTLWIFATCAFLLNGFQAIPQVVEERASNISFAKIAALIVSSILAGVLFYCFVIWTNAITIPWRNLANTEMATVTSVATLPYGRVLATILLLTAAASLFKTWNGMVIMAARLMVAMARAGAIPTAFARLHPRFGSPSAAILFILTINLAGLFLGRGAIIPIINMCSMTLTLTFVMCCAAVIKLRQVSEVPAAFQVPGGAPTIAIAGATSLAMAVAAFVTPVTSGAGGVPIEYLLLFAWSVAGLAFWSMFGRLRWNSRLGF